MWCFMVNLCQQFLDVLPPSASPRGRPISAGMIMYFRSYTNLVLLLCLWTCVLSICFNVGRILEEHGCHEWTVSTWSIRVDPCSKQSYIYTFFIIFIYIFITSITISILISHKFEIKVHTFSPAFAAGFCDDIDSKSICCCPLRPFPTYSYIFSSYYILINKLLCVIFTQTYAYIVSCATTHVSWWSIRVDPYYNWTIRVVPYLSISWNYSLWWLIYGGLTIFGGLLYLAICLCVLQLSWMFMCQLFVMWHSTMWSTLTYMFQTYILNHFATTSPSFSTI